MTSIFARFKSRSDGSGDESSPGSKAASAHARRREQVRRAQRSHRERKAEYIRNLEAEVADLRVRESNSSSEVVRCQVIAERYKALLRAHGIEVPSDIEDVESPAFMARVEVVGPIGGPQKLKATLPSPGSDLSDIAAPIAGLSVTSRDFSLNDPQVGIDFVLALEQPCLSHTKGVHPDHGGDGHILQLQAPILSHGPPEVTNKGGTIAWPAGSTWQLPSVELGRQLERLLAYSKQLSLHGELTPVMAWSKIVEHPQASLLTRAKLEQLRDALVTQIECYGFGAILGELEFYHALNQVLADRQL